MSPVCFFNAGAGFAAKPLYRLPYSALHRAADSFSLSRRLGKGDFGPVFRDSPLNPKSPAVPDVAVKVMDSGSLKNELLFVAAPDSAHIVSMLAFSADRNCRRAGLALLPLAGIDNDASFLRQRN